MRVGRWSKLFEQAQTRGLAGVALIPGPNLFYMTGLRMGLSERPMVCAVTGPDRVVFIMPQMEAQKGRAVASQLNDAGVDALFEVEAYSDEEGPSGAFAKVFGAISHEGSWAFEFRRMRLLEFSLIRNVLGDFPWIDAGEIFANMRMIKDEYELRCMEKACALADYGVDVARRLVSPGRTGHEIALQVERELKGKGCEAVGMALAIGPDSSLAHSGTSARPIAEGDLVWLDLTVSVDGYWGDITRTYAVGTIDHQLERIYKIVLEAQECARLNARPGMTGAEVDALARDVIASYGYGDYFVHRTGHGLGLEVHEEPYIVASNHVPLPIGSTFTIEPGIYIPGKGGVRIEDDVVLTENGLRSLTSYPRNLLDDEPKLVV